MRSLEQNIFPERLTQLRKSQRRTQKEFAYTINCTQGALSHYEAGDKSPGLDMLYTIASVHDVSIDWLMGISDSPNIGKFNRFQDLAESLVSIVDCCDSKSHIKTTLSTDKENITSLHIKNPDIFEFTNEYIRIRKIYKDGIINDEDYQLWLEAKLKKYNKPIE